MSKLLDRASGAHLPRDLAAPSRALDLSELEERLLLSVSPVMIAPEMLDAASTAAETASLETGVNAATPLNQTNSQDTGDLSDSNISTDPAQMATREIVFLDTSVEDYQLLLDDLWANDDPS